MGENKGYIRNTDEKGSVNISEDVIAVIAAAATADVEGVHGLYAAHGKEITQVTGKKKLTKGVKISADGDRLTIDVQIMAEMGACVNEVGAEVQNAVINAVEAAAGITVAAVNVHVCGISLKRDR
jgi:uncharacterized alkaline shock family protein YloU